MYRKFLDQYGSFGIQYVAAVSTVAGVLFLGYYLLYLAFKLVLPPLWSVVISTTVVFICVLGLGIYRYVNGPFFDIEPPEENEIPEIPTDEELEKQMEDDDETEESPDTDDGEETKTVFTTNDTSEVTVDDISEDDVPKDLYIKVVKEDDYTMADAKAETLRRKQDKD